MHTKQTVAKWHKRWVNDVVDAATIRLENYNFSVGLLDEDQQRTLRKPLPLDRDGLEKYVRNRVPKTNWHKIHHFLWENVWVPALGVFTLYSLSFISAFSVDSLTFVFSKTALVAAAVPESVHLVRLDLLRCPQCRGGHRQRHCPQCLPKVLEIVRGARPRCRRSLVFRQ